MDLNRQRYKLLNNKRRARNRSFRCLVLVLPLVLCLGYKEVKSYFQKPQAVLVLGGSTTALEREKFAAKFALQYPDLPIWVSGGSPNQRYTKRVFAKAGIDPSRLRLDYQAVDTVTNFTTLVDDLQARGIHSVYLITSDYHMRRARIIGEIVLGSRGINFKAVRVPSNRSPESIEKAIRDGGRAIVWLLTGHTGASISKRD